MRKQMFTLLYGGEVLSWSSDGYILLEEKAELIYSRSVLYPELLEIYLGGYPWFFDKKFDYKLACFYLIWCRLRYPLGVKEYALVEKSF